MRIMTKDASPGENVDPDSGKSSSRIRSLGGKVKRFAGAKQKFQMPTGEGGLKIVVATDAWSPQVNGVVTSLATLGDILTDAGNEVLYITPLDFRSVPMPTYPEIRLSLFPNRKVAALINKFKPDAIHIATEGPIGRATRRFCRRRKYPYTTSFHTRFAEYTNERLKLPISWGYALLRDFHRHGETMMVATPALREELEARGFHHMKIWSRGVDTDQFRPMQTNVYDGLPRPIFTYVGRVAVEKSIEDFLKLDLPGTKVVVGSGPQLAELQAAYPEAHFAGPKFGAELAEYYAGSDVFVFPSRTDTFGLVNIEALACGVPVAAYPVRGPADILDGAPPGAGCLDEDLKKACLTALEARDPVACRTVAEQYSWEAAARQFVANLEIPGFDEDFWLRSAKMIEDPILPT